MDTQAAHRHHDLAPEQQEQVHSLLRTVREHDGVDALDEAYQLRLDQDATHVVVEDGSDVVGYAQAIDVDGVTEVGIVVAPAARRHGVGTALLQAAIDAAPYQGWAHGDLAASEAFALHHGAKRVRTLLKMTWQASELPPREVPHDVVLRTLRPGPDDADLLRVNADAFSFHPEQGGWEAADLQDRYEQSWFSADDVFIAERESDGAMLGFHWTKRATHGRGEVYVIGVSPQAQGLGLGGVLLNKGLQHLVARGDDLVDLYVEADNESAVALYEKRGFAVSERHVMWRVG